MQASVPLPVLNLTSPELVKDIRLAQGSLPLQAFVWRGENQVA